MIEFEPASVAKITTARPARHGAPWMEGEVAQLIEEIRQGLTLVELAERHQRTAAGITGAAMRLIPPAVRPEIRARSVDVLAQHLREQNGVGTQVLIANFGSVGTANIQSKAARSSRNSSTQSVVDEHQIGLAATAATSSGHVRITDTKPDCELSVESPAEVADGCRHDADVSMLIIAAIATLSRSQDCSLLRMRLGIDGQPLTLAEIGAQWGISGERVRQLQERALRRLARSARSEGTPGSLLKTMLAPLRESDKALTTWLLDTVSNNFEIPYGMAAKFILRAAGCSKEKTAELVALMSAVEHARKSELRTLTPDRAAERAATKVDQWLKYTDWPDVIAPPLPAAHLSAHRLVNESDIAGSFHSNKLDCTVQYESGLELEVLTALEQSEQIAYYREQPARISYTFDNRKRVYYPDVFAATVDGRGFLIEIKPIDNMALSINRAKAEAARAWAHAHGWGWLIVSDRLTFREIEEHTVPADVWTLLENELKARGVLTWRDMLHFRTRYDLTRFDFTAYIVQSGANLDQAYHVTPP